MAQAKNRWVVEELVESAAPVLSWGQNGASLTVHGPIDGTVVDAVAKLVASKESQLTLCLSSPGGSIPSALAIADLLRWRGADRVTLGVLGYVGGAAFLVVAAAWPHVDAEPDAVVAFTPAPSNTIPAIWSNVKARLDALPICPDIRQQWHSNVTYPWSLVFPQIAKQ